MHCHLWIDSFFKKCDTGTSTKKQRDDKEVKEDEAQPSNSEPKNHLSASKSSSDHQEWTQTKRIYKFLF